MLHLSEIENFCYVHTGLILITRLPVTFRSKLYKCSDYHWVSEAAPSRMTQSWPAKIAVKEILSWLHRRGSIQDFSIIMESYISLNVYRTDKCYLVFRVLLVLCKKFVRIYQGNWMAKATVKSWISWSRNFSIFSNITVQSWGEDFNSFYLKSQCNEKRFLIAASLTFLRHCKLDWKKLGLGSSSKESFIQVRAWQEE